MLKSGLLCFLLFAMTSWAQAKDVSAQQVGVEYAHDTMDKADTAYKAALQRVADSEKHLAEAQQRLADDRQKAAVSRQDLETAKLKYQKAQEVLDKAWKQP